MKKRVRHFGRALIQYLPRLARGLCTALLVLVFVAAPQFIIGPFLPTADAIGSPTVTGISPNSGTNQGGTSVTISGTGFQNKQVFVKVEVGHQAGDSSNNNTCGLTTDGKVYCWGYGGQGQLGNNSTTNSSLPVAVNTSGVMNGKTIVDITVGGGHSCAVDSNGAAYCWGYNLSGQLGNNSTTQSSVPVAVNTTGVLSGKTVTQIAATDSTTAGGNGSTCVVASGAAYCWGYNGSGQLGNNSTTQSSVPVAVNTTGVLSGKTVTQISTGGSSTCATASGAAYCWGHNSQGQLGDNSTTQRNVPVAVNTTGVLSGKTVTQISTSGDSWGHSCAVASGAAYCWGYNSSGQLGNNSTTQSSVPVAVNTTGVLSGKTVTQIATADPTFNSYSCAIASGSSYCWGYNNIGQLGNNSTTQSNVPVANTTPGASSYTMSSISIGYNTTCISTTNPSSASFCWGKNGSGQFGNNTTTDSATATQVVVSGLPSGIATVTIGGTSATNVTYINTTTLTATTPAGTIGPATVTITNPDSTSASLTNGFTYIDTAPYVTSVSPNAGPTAGGTPVTINGSNFTKSLSSFVQVDTNNGTSCGVTADGAAYCWGDNSYGQLGDGTTTQRLTPVAVDTSGVLSGKTVTQISTSGSSTCVVASGAAYCWGDNSYGQLGDNSTTQRLTPVAVNTSGVFSGKTVTQISVDLITGLAGSTCAVASGAAYCWGNNVLGQLGDNSTTQRLTPVAVNTAGVLGGKTVTQVSTSGATTCAVASGAAYCWGYGAIGQLGNNGIANSNVPVAVNTAGVLNGKTVTQVSTSFGSSCAVASGAAYCWGDNSQGQLGNNSTSQSNVPVAVNTAGVLNGKTVTQVSTGAYVSGGSYATCAVASGAAYCWGSNPYGQLGNNSTTQSLVPVAVNTSGVLSGKTVTQISASGASTCAIASGVTPYCWGGGAGGQLGNNSTSQSSVPVTVIDSLGFGPLSVTFGGTAATSVTYLSSTQIQVTAPAKSAGAATVAVTNPNTQSGSLTNAFTYTGAASAPTVSSVSPNAGTTAGGTSVTLSGTNLTNNLNFVKITTGSDYYGVYGHSCGLTASGQAYCWGYNLNGQLGNGTTTQSSAPVPVDTSGILSGKTVVQISAGTDSTCALTADNILACWGWNYSGQLGNNSFIDSSVPVAVNMSGVLSGKTIRTLQVGLRHACVVATDNTGYCWGEGNNGKLGNNGTTGSAVPVAVSGGLSFISIYPGINQTCATTTSYRAYCWGINDVGQLGNNTTTDSLVPTPVTASGVLSGKSIVQTITTNQASCALDNTGAAYCWGVNWGGQLGNNTTTASLVPVASTMGGKVAINLSGGSSDTFCATTTSGIPACWGYNNYGQQGSGSTGVVLIPTDMATTGALSGKTITDVATTEEHSCMRASDNTVSCTGYDNAGQLGDGTTTNTTQAVATLGYAMPTSITFGGTAATNLAYVNSSTVTATTPAHSSGAVNVALTRADSQSSTLTNGYTYATIPGAPTGLTTTPATNAVTLNWTAPASNGGSPITDYTVEYSSNGGANWSTVTHTASTATTQTVTGLVPGTTYTFRVSAVNAIGTGSASTTATGTPTFITLASTSSVLLSVTPDSSSRISSKSGSATVSTNNLAGYTLQLSTTTTDRNLTRSGGADTILPSAGTVGAPTALGADSWGYRVDNLGAFGSGTFLETNVTASSFTWAGVPNSSTPATIKSTSAPATNDPTTIWYAMRAAPTKPSGNYTNTILYTAVVN